MQKLNTWLDAERGRASRLAEKLGVARSHLSQVRSGLLKVPTDWMPTIAKFTNGAVSIESMVLQQAKGRVAARKKRRQELSAAPSPL